MRQLIPRYGFLPTNTSTCPSPVRYPVVNNNAVAIFRGDPVTIQADGTVAAAAAGAGNLITGVASHFSIVINGLRTDAKWIPANTTFVPATSGSPNATYCWVWEDPNIEFTASMSPDVLMDTLIESREIRGQCCAHVYTAAGNIFGQSGCQLNGNTILAATNASQWRITGCADDLGDDYTNALGNVMFRCVIDQGTHQFMQALGI